MQKRKLGNSNIEAQQLIESQQRYGVELIAPVQNNGRWQREQGTGFDLSHFIIESLESAG